jgi:hypothetical protein
MTVAVEQDATKEAATQPLLHALDGKPAPAEMGDALAKLASLPEAGRSHIRDLIVSNLEALAEDQLDNRIVRLCRRLELDAEQVAPVVKACHFLFRTAATNNVEPRQLAVDLRALCAPHPIVAELLEPIYAEALPALQQESVVRALGEHGKVFGGVSWRIDTIGATSHCKQLGIPIALVTLHYKDGNDGKRITLQMVPEMLGQLREACDAMLGEGAR